MPVTRQTTRDRFERLRRAPDCERCGKPGWRAHVIPRHSALLGRQVLLCRWCRESYIRHARSGRKAGQESARRRRIRDVAGRVL